MDMSKSSEDGERALREFRWTAADSITCAIVDEVTELDGVSVDDLDPLYDSIDPDLLERLFEPRGAPPAPFTGELRFEYAGHLVVINADGHGSITVSDDADSSASVDGLICEE